MSFSIQFFGTCLGHFSKQKKLYLWSKDREQGYSGNEGPTHIGPEPSVGPLFPEQHLARSLVSPDVKIP